jgi:molybdopterin synthase catalytic subunit
MREKKPKQVLMQGAISPEFIGNSIAKHQSKKDIGAHSIFLGQVRNDVIDNKEVIAIDYSCYEEMANTTFLSIREALFQKYKYIIYWIRS